MRARGAWRQAEGYALMFWPLEAKSRLIGKNSDAGKD